MRHAFEAFDRRLNPSSAAPLAVAFSGGSDSTALLRLTLDWARRHGRRVTALIVDHRLQPESRAWTERSTLTARRLGAEARSLAWEGDKPATGLPAAARQARHRLLAEAAREAGAGVILLGHTRDDLREAALMRAQGSSVGSPQEWSPSPAWPEGRDLFHFRPLLSHRREELRDWLSGNGADWIEDPANADQRYARARARAALAVDDADTLEAAPAPDLAALAALAQAQPWGGFSLDRPGLLRADPAAARRFLQVAISCAAGSARPARRDRIAALLDRLREGATGAMTLGGARLVAGGALLVMREAGDLSRRGTPPLELEPGSGQVWDGRFELRCGRAGASVRALAGAARRLDPSEHRLLIAWPAPARRAAPLVEWTDGAATCPLLAKRPGLDCRSLSGRRLLAACGVIAREG